MKPAVLSSRMENHEALVGVAQLAGLSQNAGQHRRQLARMLADQPQHLGHRGLQRQRRIELVEQLRVADRDRRLLAEGSEDAGLAVVERADLVAVHAQHAVQLTVDPQADRQKAAHVVRYRAARRREREQVVHTDGLAGAQRHHRRGYRRPRRTHRFRMPRIRQERERVAIEPTYDPGVGAAEANRAVDQDVHHRDEVTGMRADEGEHLAGGRLELERLLEALDEVGAGDGERRLLAEGRECGELVLAERPHLVAVHVQRADRRPFLGELHDGIAAHARNGRETPLATGGLRVTINAHAFDHRLRGKPPAWPLNRCRGRRARRGSNDGRLPPS